MWTVERLNLASNFESIREDWNRLAFGNRMRSADWGQVWWENLARRCVPYILVVRDGSRIQGIFPLMLETTALRGRRLILAGSGKACGDNLGILAEPGQEAHVVRHVAHWLAHAKGADAWDSMDLDGVQPSDSVMADFQQQLQSDYQIVVERRASESCWAIDLSGGWDQVLGNLSKRTRRMVKNNLVGEYIEPGRARLKIAESLAEAQSMLQLTAAFHQTRWNERSIDGCFGTEGFNGFLVSLVDRWWPTGIAYVAMLELDGQSVAGAIGMWGPNELALYLVGMKIEAHAHRPGLLLSLESMRLAIRHGKASFNFLRGDEEYKARLGAQPTVQQRWLATSPRWLPQLRGAALRKGIEVRDWFRHRTNAAGRVATTQSSVDANT